MKLAWPGLLKCNYLDEIYQGVDEALLLRGSSLIEFILDMRL